MRTSHPQPRRIPKQGIDSQGLAYDQIMRTRPRVQHPRPQGVQRRLQAPHVVYERLIRAPQKRLRLRAICGETRVRRHAVVIASFGAAAQR